MHIVKHTLQTRDPKTKEAVYYTASPTPQKLPADLAKEAVARGFALKVEAEKKPTKKTAAKKVTETAKSDASTDADIDFDGDDESQGKSEESSTDQSDE
jgi:hypothetical protein